MLARVNMRVSTYDAITTPLVDDPDRELEHTLVVARDYDDLVQAMPRLTSRTVVAIPLVRESYADHAVPCPEMCTKFIGLLPELAKSVRAVVIGNQGFRLRFVDGLGDKARLRSSKYCAFINALAQRLEELGGRLAVFLGIDEIMRDAFVYNGQIADTLARCLATPIWVDGVEIIPGTQFAIPSTQTLASDWYTFYRTFIRDRGGRHGWRAVQYYLESIGVWACTGFPQDDRAQSAHVSLLANAGVHTQVQGYLDLHIDHQLLR